MARFPDESPRLKSRSWRPLETIEFASTAAQQLLEQNGLADTRSVFSRQHRAQLRHAGRAVLGEQLVDESGNAVRVFAKLYFGSRRWWPRMTDLKTGQAFESLPLREWRGIERVAALGVNGPERLAIYREGLLSPRAVVIVKAVPPPQSLDEMLAGGSWNKLSAGDRRAVLARVVEATRRIHAAGLAWRGASSRHYFPQKQPDGRWQIWLIDLEGVHRRVNATDVERDFSKLLRAMRESGADPATIRTMQELLDGSGIRSECHASYR